MSLLRQLRRRTRAHAGRGIASRRGKRIAGVCAGLAEEFGISVTILRLAFLLGTLVGGGLGIVLYLVLWVVMPYRPDESDWPALPPPG